MSYGNLIGHARAGLLVDSSDYNIDGTCYVASNQLNLHVGRVVHVNKIYDGIYKEISGLFNPDKAQSEVAYGVVYRGGVNEARIVDGLPVFSPLEPVSIVTHGRVWVASQTFSEAPAVHAPVHITPHGLATGAGALEITGWTYTGDFYRIDSTTSIVGVQVKQNHGHLENEFKVKVNGVHLTRSPEGDLAYNTQVLLTAEVSPANATDKTGTWHLVNPLHGEIKSLSGNQAQFTPTRSLIGEVTIVWQANDGSDVSGMVKINYVP